MRDTTIRTHEALGQAIRTQRMAQGISQAELARRIGVERKWVVRLEKGNHAAEFGNVLKAIEALNLDLVVRKAMRATDVLLGSAGAPNLDEVFQQLKRDPQK
jgi:transcriptional regulator with XRE-family HTH domain